LGFKLVTLVVKKGRLRWFGHIECKDGPDWVKLCMMIEVMELERGTSK